MSSSQGVVIASNQSPVSVAGTVIVTGLQGASVSGAVSVSNLPTTQNVSGSVAAFMNGSWSSSVEGTVSVLGTVPVTQAGAWSSSVMTNVITSIATAGQVMGSVAALQGTNPWVVSFANSSILAVPVGSTIAYLQAPSIVGTYAEDAAHTTGEKGMFVLGVRNDTLSSVTSADGDYTPMAQGPVGETVVANSPITKWIQGTADLRVVLGASVTAIAAQGTSVFTYITGVQVANFGPSSVLVTLSGGLGSILGYTIAPAGGGSNIVYPNALKTGANSAFTASINGTASVLVSAQGFVAKI